MISKFSFSGHNFTGYLDGLQVPSPEGKTSRMFHWGTIGETEVRGGAAGRTITFNFLLSNAEYTTLPLLSVGLGALEGLINEHGLLDLYVTGSAGLVLFRGLPNCTFDSFTLADYGGRGSVGPQWDITGGLASVPAWYVYLNLSFRQLAYSESTSASDSLH